MEIRIERADKATRRIHPRFNSDPADPFNQFLKGIKTQ